MTTDLAHEDLAYVTLHDKLVPNINKAGNAFCIHTKFEWDGPTHMPGSEGAFSLRSAPLAQFALGLPPHTQIKLNV